MMGRRWGITFSDSPYMSGAERAEFKRFRDGGVVSAFGVAICAANGCDREVPRGVKLYCSDVCWRKEEGHDETKEEETGEVD